MLTVGDCITLSIKLVVDIQIVPLSILTYISCGFTVFAYCNGSAFVPLSASACVIWNVISNVSFMPCEISVIFSFKSKTSLPSFAISSQTDQSLGSLNSGLDPTSIIKLEVP